MDIITRKIDDLGRLVLPIECRRFLGVEERDGIDIIHDASDGKKVILQKHVDACLYCGNTNSKLISFKNNLICEHCLKELKKL